MQEIFSILQSSTFQIALAAAWAVGIYYWRTSKGQHTTADKAKATGLVAISVFTLISELSIWHIPNEGAPNLIRVNIDQLTSVERIEFQLKCIGTQGGPPVCSKVPIVKSAPLPDCKDLGELDGCINKKAIVSALQTARYGFNSPTNMTLSEPETFALVIDSTGSTNFKTELQSLPGTIEEGTTPISLQMEAELVGPAFKILPEGRQRLELSRLNPTRWDWQVTPKREGQHQLEVSLFVILTKAGKKISEDKSLAERRIIDVTVSRFDRVLSFIQKIDPLRALIFTVIAAIAAVLAWFGYKSGEDFSGRPPKPDKPTQIEVSFKKDSDETSSKEDAPPNGT